MSDRNLHHTNLSTIRKHSLPYYKDQRDLVEKALPPERGRVNNQGHLLVQNSRN